MLQNELGLDLLDSILCVSEDGRQQLCVANLTGFTCQVAPGTQLGRGFDMAIVGEEDVSAPTPLGNRQLASDPSVRLGCCVAD